MNYKILTGYNNSGKFSFLEHPPNTTTYPNSVGALGDSPPDIQGHLTGLAGLCLAPGYTDFNGGFS
jgi:hypothetical protein